MSHIDTSFACYPERKLEQRCHHLLMTDDRCLWLLPVTHLNMSPLPWWPLSCEPLSWAANQRPELGCSDQSEASITKCNRGEINDRMTCGHRSHSDKLLTANSWSASAQIARRMLLTPHIICCHFRPGLSLVIQSLSGLSLVSLSSRLFVSKVSKTEKVKIDAYVGRRRRWKVIFKTINLLYVYGLLFPLHNFLILLKYKILLRVTFFAISPVAITLHFRIILEFIWNPNYFPSLSSPDIISAELPRDQIQQITDAEREEGKWEICAS